MSDFKGRHFGGEIVLWAICWYCRYPISYRDLETMMTERGVAVDHSTIYRWVQHYAPKVEKRLRWRWHRPQSHQGGILPCPWHQSGIVVVLPGQAWDVGLCQDRGTAFGVWLGCRV